MSVTLLGKWLKKNQLTQVRFAEMTRKYYPGAVKQPMISRFVRGLQVPGRRYAHAIEKATGGAVKSEYWDRIQVRNNPKSK